jgi:AAHS family 4-hydroxybenzoate transporter-like MFS transporter
MTKYVVTVIGVAIIMVDGYDLQSIGFVAPEIALSWSLDIAAFGPVFSAGLAGTIPGALMAGPIARVVGQRVVLALSLVVFGGGTLATSLATDVAMLTGLRFLVGVGLGAAVPLVMSIVAENTPARFRATLITVVLCGQPVGAIVGAALCSRLIPAFGWQSAFLVGGLLPLVLLPAVLALPHARSPYAGQARSQHGARSSGRLSELFGAELLSTTLLLWATAFLAVFLLYILVNWLPGVVRAEGHSLQASLLAISLFNAGGIAGAILVGALIDRFGPFRIVPSVFLLASLCIASLDLVHESQPLFLAASLLSGFAGYGGGACVGSLAILLYPPALSATGAGWVLGIGRLGAAIGPLGVGAALGAGMAPSRLFYFAASAAVLAALCLTALGSARAHMSSRNSATTAGADVH